MAFMCSLFATCSAILPAVGLCKAQAPALCRPAPNALMGSSGHTDANLPRRKWARVDSGRYGTDPRRRGRRLRWWLRAILPTGAAVSLVPLPGQVGMLSNVDELSSVIQTAGDRRFVCIKVTSNNCKGCKQIAPHFAEQAGRHAAEGLFFEARYEQAGTGRP